MQSIILALENEDTERFELKIEGIVENYVNHYVYMTSDLYENIFKEYVKYTKNK
ncbi:MAG: hypothetical protein ACRCXT_04960 [Paraclostridium sp.]